MPDMIVQNVHTSKLTATKQERKQEAQDNNKRYFDRPGECKTPINSGTSKLRLAKLDSLMRRFLIAGRDPIGCWRNLSNREQRID